MDNIKLAEALAQIERLKQMVTDMGGDPAVSPHESFIKKTCVDKWHVEVRESSNTTNGRRSASYKNVFILNSDGHNIAQVYSGGCKEDTFFIAHLIAAIPALLWIMQYVVRVPNRLGKTYNGVKLTTALFYKQILARLEEVVNRCDPEKYTMSFYGRSHKSINSGRYALRYKEDLKDVERLIKRGDIKVPAKW